MRFPWWRSPATRPSPSTPRIRRKPSSRLPLRLAVEQLEDRCVPDASLSSLHIPLAFEINQGQTDPSVNFLASGQGYNLFLTPSASVLSLNNGTSSDVLWTTLVGANAAPQVVGQDPLAGTSNYFLGNDASKWITNVPNFGQVAYQNVYNGVNLVYHSSDTDQLEYDFVVSPGANAGVIQMNFAGAQGLSLDAQGNLVIQMSGGSVVQNAPVLYQTINGVQTPVAGNFVLEGGNQVGFAVGAYDHTQALTIDPMLGFSSYLGGSGPDAGQAIAVDSTNTNLVYVAGFTSSPVFPTTPNQPANSGPNDSAASNAFVAKFDLSTGQAVFSATLGGDQSLTSVATGIALDGTNDGLAYITGQTNAPDFPTSAGALRTTLGGAQNAFFSVLQTVAPSNFGLNFALSSSAPVAGTSPDALAVADFDFAKGNDIAVANNGNGSVTVMLNNGAGGFTTQTIAGVGINPDAIATATFENSGFDDLVVGSENGGGTNGGLTVLANTGVPSFSLPFGQFAIDPSFVIPNIPNVTAIGIGFNNTNATKKFSIDDVSDGSNTPDIAVADDVGNFVKILTLSNVGSNTFTVQQTIGFTNPHSVALVDLNGDGHLDLVVADNNGVWVAQGTGEDNSPLAPFGAPVLIFADPTVSSVIAENLATDSALDFNGDGKPDLAITDTTGKVWVITNTTAVGGALAAVNFASTSFNVGANPQSLTTGDFNGDGRTDIAAANQGGNTVSVLINTTVGGVLSFAPAQPFNLPAGAGPTAIVGAPFGTGFAVKDTKFDLAVADGLTNQVSILDNISAPFYSTYLGSTGTDSGSGIAVNGTTVYIVGTSNAPSSQFVTNGAPVSAPANFVRKGGQDAFVAQLTFNSGAMPPSAAFTQLTFAGGTGIDFGNGIALDSAGMPYIVGTTSGGIPAVPGPTDQLVGTPLQGAFGGSSDAFVEELTPGTLAPLYGTYYGGTGTDTGAAIAVLGSGVNTDIYITGSTTGNLPNINPVGNPTSAFQPTFAATGAGSTDAYIASWQINTAAVLYASYIGGSAVGGGGTAGSTTGTGIAVDAAGNAYVVGSTTWKPAGLFSNTNPNDQLQNGAGNPLPGYNSNNNQGGQDGFLIKVKAGAGLTGVGYFDFLGGGGADSVNGIALAAGINPSNPSIFLVGTTTSLPAAIITNGSSYGGGADDAFVMRLDPLPAPTLTSVAVTTPAGGNLTEGDANKADTVTLTGTGFDVNSTVVVQTPSGTETLTPVTNSGTVITVAIPNTNVAPDKPLLAEEGTATFTVQSGEGGSSGSMSLTIQDANLVAGALTPPVATEGIAFAFTTVFHFTDNDPNGTAADYTASVAVGNGTTLTSAANPANVKVVAHVGGGFDVQLAFTYLEEILAAANAVFSVTVTDNPASATASSAPGFTVADAALAAGALTPPVATEGIAFTNTVVFHFTDADPNGTASDYQAVVQRGDGTSVTLTSAPTANGQIVANGGGFDVQLSYTYAEAIQASANKTFSVTVSDAGGSALPAQTKTPFTVADAAIGAPTEDATLSGTTVFQGAPIYAAPGLLADFTDANLSASSTAADFNSGNAGPDGTIGTGDVTINWGDGKPLDHANATQLGAGNLLTVNKTGPGTFTISGNHTYATLAVFTVTVTVYDSDGATNSSTFTINSQGPLNTPMASALPAITEGTNIFVPGPTGSIGTFKDAIAGETTANFTSGAGDVTINWKDGTPLDHANAANLGAGNLLTITGTPATFTISGNHNYHEDGTYNNVTITVTDSSGAVLTFTTNITVLDANLTFTPGVIALPSIAEGGAGEVNQTVATFTDANPFAPLSDFPNANVTINWGDGSPTTTGTVSQPGGVGTQFVVKGSHVYEDSPAVPASGWQIKVTVNDAGGKSIGPTLTATAVVTDPQIAITSTATGVNAFGALRNTPTPFETLFTFNDPGASGPADTDEFVVSVNWGDGVTETLASPNIQLVSTGGTTFKVQGTHDYTTNPPMDGLNAGFIVIQVTHGMNATLTVNDDCVIGNIPVTPSPGPTFTATEGILSATQTVATFTQTSGLDANKADYTADIAWGDGQTTLNATITFAGNTGTVTGSHVYAEEGSDTITVTIHHSVPGLGTLDATVNTPASVGDAALTGGAAVTINAVEGAAVNGVVVATFTDANPTPPLSDFSATITWGDGTTSTGTIQALGGNAFQVVASKASPFAEEGSYGITVSIKDVGGSAVTVSGTVVVADAKLSGNGVDFSGIATQAQTLVVATFSDADPGGTVTDYTASINWGDGTVTGGTVQASGGSFSVTGTHGYRSRGTFTVTITVNDAGGASVTLTATADIAGAPDIIATGADAGGGPEVKVFDAATHTLLADFYAFTPSFTGGVRVAVGDVNGDGIPDVVAVAGPGGGPEVIVFDGANGYQPMAGVFGGFYALTPSFTGGLYVAVGDVNGDGYGDIIVGAGEGGGPEVAVFSGKDGSELANFYTTTSTFTGGVRVAAGDVEGIKRDDIIVAYGPGSASLVEVINFQKLQPVQVLLAFDGLFTGGLYVAAGDVNGDGHADVIVSAGPGGGPEVLVFDGAHDGTLLNDFFANIGNQVDLASPQGGSESGVRVGTAQIDSKTVITTIGGPGALPLVTDLDGVTLQQIDAFFAYDPSFRFGGFVS